MLYLVLPVPSNICRAGKQGRRHIGLKNVFLSDNRRKFFDGGLAIEGEDYIVEDGDVMIFKI